MMIFQRTDREQSLNSEARLLMFSTSSGGSQQDANESTTSKETKEKTEAEKKQEKAEQAKKTERGALLQQISRANLRSGIKSTAQKILRDKSSSQEEVDLVKELIDGNLSSTEFQKRLSSIQQEGLVENKTPEMLLHSLGSELSSQIAELPEEETQRFRKKTNR